MKNSEKILDISAEQLRKVWFDPPEVFPAHNNKTYCGTCFFEFEEDDSICPICGELIE